MRPLTSHLGTWEHLLCHLLGPVVEQRLCRKAAVTAISNHLSRRSPRLRPPCPASLLFLPEISQPLALGVGGRAIWDSSALWIAVSLLQTSGSQHSGVLHDGQMNLVWWHRYLIDIQSFHSHKTSVRLVSLKLFTDESWSRVSQALLAFGAGWSSVVGCPVPCRMLNSIPGLNPLDVSSIPLSCHPVGTTKTVSRHCPVFPVGRSHPHLSVTALGVNVPKSHWRGGVWFWIPVWTKAYACSHDVLHCFSHLHRWHCSPRPRVHRTLLPAIIWNFLPFPIWLGQLSLMKR